jgi:predicted nucleotidyltransferase
MVKNHSKIIRVLLERQEEELNIAKISKYSRIDYKNTYNIIKDLEKNGLVVVKLFGKNKRVILNKKVHPLIFRAEYERRQDLFRKNKDFKVLYRRLSELQFPFIALLFGSYAKGKATKHSDIDLLIVGGDEKEINSVISLWPEKIHLTSVTYKDFIYMAKSKEFTVVSEAIKNNIILIGIEEYYRLLANAE